MLVLSRKVGQKIQIGDQVIVSVLRINGSTVRLGIEAADDTPILRRELEAAAKESAANQPAAQSASAGT